MLPKIVDHDIESQFGVFELTSMGFFFTLFIQWWSIAAFGVENVNSPMLIQKVMSAKNEKHSMWAMLLFTLIHYCMRPWVWIILGLISVSFYPNFVAEGNTVYAILRLDQPVFRVLLLIMFLGMYMSNMSSQFNLAASYLFNDLINPIWKEKISRDANSDQRFTSAPIFIAPILVVIVGLFSLWLSVGNTKYLITLWNFLLQVGTGAGFVLVARWFWWRINIWTEWTCFISPVLGIFFAYLFEIDFQRSFFVITFSTIFISVAITYLTNPEGIDVLESFFEKAQIGGLFRKKKLFSISTYSQKQELIFWIIDWLLGVISFYSLMFAIGRAIFSQYLSSIVLMLVSLTSMMLLLIDLDRRGWMKSKPESKKQC